MRIWWHERVLRHQVKLTRMVNVPPFHHQEAELWRCSCRKVWTR